MTSQTAFVELRNPYPGLRPFDVHEFESFFGRDQQVDELLVRLRDHRFVAVVGLSGSGKSSLVRAGLIHRLQVGHLTNAGSRWLIALFRPGSHPIEALAAALDEALGKAPDREKDLRRHTQQLLHETRIGREPGENLLIVVDQFEEIFRFQREQLLSRRDASHFIDLLLAAEQDLSPDYRVYVVLTMRTDYLGDCAQFDGLPEALNRGQYLVPRLTRDQTREAIEGPAALMDTEIAPDLLQTLLVESAEGPDRLPLLQHALMRLWEINMPDTTEGWKITLDDYKTLGGMARALNDHADATLGELSEDQKALAKRIFQELTEIGQGRDQRHPLRLSDLARRTGGDLVVGMAVVEHFTRASFLTSPDRGREEDWEVDISHESLIRQWKTLNHWAAEEAQDRDDYLYFAKRVERKGGLLTDTDLALAMQWQKRERSEEWAKRYGGDYAATIAFIEQSRLVQHNQREREEQQRRGELRRARQLQTVFAAAACLCLVLLLIAFLFYRRAVNAKTDADQARVAADNAALIAKQSAAEASREKIHAQEQTESAQRSAAEASRDKLRAEEEASKAQISAHESKAQELAAFSVERLSDSPETSILLGIQAVGATRRFGLAPVPASEDALHNALLASHLRRTLRGHSRTVMSVAFSPDGKRIATGSIDKTAKIWDTESGKELLTLRGHSNTVESVAFSPDGKRIATGSGDATAKVWDTKSGEELMTLRALSTVTSVAFSPDSRRIVTGGYDKTAKIWDAESGKELVTLLGHSEVVNSAVFSSDGSRIATGSGDETAKIWDAESGKELVTLRGHSSSVKSVVFSPDDKRIATGSLDKTAKIWDTESGKELMTLRHSDFVTSVRFSPDGRRIATGSLDKTAKIWDAEIGTELVTLREHTNIIMTSVAFSPDGRRIATGSWDAARVWDAESDKELITLRGYGVAFSPDGTRIATGSDHTAKILDAESGTELVSLIGHSESMTSFAFSPDGKRIATGSGDRTAKVWDTKSGKELMTLRGHYDPVTSVAFSPDGRRIATAGGGKNPKVWDAESGTELVSLRGHLPYLTRVDLRHGGVISVAFSPDGRRIATGDTENTAKVWDAKSGRELKILRGHSESVDSVGFSPDGRQIVTGSGDHTAKLWDAENGKLLVTLRGHSGAVTSVAFSPDGKQVATGSYDYTAKLWDAENGKLLVTLRGHSGAVISVAFSPDGKRLASASEDQTVQVFAVDLHDLLALARKRVTRELTLEECKQYFQTGTCPPLP
jgi:WD40 repeat protein